MPEMPDRGTWDPPPIDAASTTACASSMCVYFAEALIGAERTRTCRLHMWW